MADDDEINIFDRKFVVDNLRSQLRCPKCIREYSHKYANEGASTGKLYI